MGLIAASTLLAEILWMRIFSAAIWYHFAFLVVSVALLGFGFSGILLHVWPKGWLWRDEYRVSPLCILSAASLILAYVLTNKIAFRPFTLFVEPMQFLVLAIYYVVLSIPFLCAGLAIGLMLTHRHRWAGLYYGCDLVGAGIGVLLFYFLIHPLGARRSILVAALLAVLAALFFPGARRRRPRTFAAAALLGIAVLLVAPQLLPKVRTDISKALSMVVEGRNDRIIHTEWNVLSRIDVLESQNGLRNIMIDGGASTPLSERSEQGLGPQNLANRTTAAAFAALEHPRVLVIGSGGGTDVRIALVAGAAHVTGAEINPSIVRLVQNDYRDFLGGLFEHPQVKLVEAEGRHFVRDSERSLDLIQLTLIDTWAASASGAYSLSENYLYTVEAIRDYMGALNDGGILSITRWRFEMPRLLSVARAAVPNAANQIVVVEQDQRATLLLCTRPFTATQIGELEAFCERGGSKITFGPAKAHRTVSDFTAILLTPDLEPIYEVATVNLRPATDDNPFFFQQARWKDIDPKSIGIGRTTSALKPTAVPAGEIALLAVLAWSLILSCVFLILPLALKRDRSVSLSAAAAPLFYFCGLGVAFIVMEIATMQRFGLFLGHPSYAITVVMFSILVASGIGSLQADRFGADPSRSFWRLALAIPASIVLHFLLSLVLFDKAHGASFVVRAALTVGVVAPPAFFMGMAFPSAVRELGKLQPALIPWGWALNGSFSVVGSSLAVLGAMMFGFRAMILCTAAVFLWSFLRWAGGRGRAGAAR
jgi:spermidine synthase